MSSRFRPVLLPSEVVIFEGSIPVKDAPRFPTEEEAWEYIDQKMENKEEANINDKVGE